MIKEIEKWLQEPVYWNGVELYDKYGESPVLKRMFQGTADNFNKKKLGAELMMLLEAAKAAEAIKPVIPDSVEITQLKVSANSLMDERSALKERARTLISQGTKEGDELKEIAFSLAYNIRESLDSIFGRIQYAKVNGSLPETTGSAINSIAQMVRRRNTLRTYTSRGGKPEKLEKWKAELFELELKIKEMEP